MEVCGGAGVEGVFAGGSGEAFGFVEVLYVLKEFGVVVGVDEHQACVAGLFVMVGNKIVGRGCQVVPAVEG